MSKAKPRTAANAVETVTLSVNERILKECYDLYTNEEKGFVILGAELGVSLLVPKKKITVMLIGNHSAGKSSFINWYVEEHVQRTAVAIETQGFTLITSGKKRESLTGNATLHLYPQLKELQKIDGFVDFLTTEVSTSKQKKFPLVTFIDTPGLVDGDMEYPFDVDTAVTMFGDMADLIFVLFDPIGQALCKRTLNIVESLNAKYPERIFFFLSKADTAGTETDRQRVLMQITQELCKRRGLNKPGLKMPTIFIPSLTAKAPRCENELEELCREVEKAITQNIQNTLNTLEKDAITIATQIDAALERDRQANKANFRACTRGLGLYFLGLLPFLMLFLSTLATQIERKVVEKWLGAQGTDVFYSYVLPVSRVAHSIPFPFPFNFAVIIFFALLVLWIAKRASRSKSTLSRKDTKLLLEKRLYVNDYIKKKKSQLYSEYLQQSVGSLDLA